MTTGERERFDEKELAHLEKRLLEERRLALRELGVLAESLGATQQAQDGDLSTYRFHMADQGTDTMEQEKNVLFASKEGRLLGHIDDALRRLYRSPETFGRCERCGRLMDFARLDAIPHTRLCVRCKQEAEARAASRAPVVAAEPGEGEDGDPEAPPKARAR